jgi:hypothetical protein
VSITFENTSGKIGKTDYQAQCVPYEPAGIYSEMKADAADHFDGAPAMPEAREALCSQRKAGVLRR